jgi:hypothetical protein
VRRTGRRASLGAALALATAIALMLAPTANASLGVLGSFGTPNGAAAGQVERAEGIAVNRTGAGGAEAGDVYLAEGPGFRVQQFDAEGNPVRIFGWNVVASGPDNVTPASAVQKIEVPAPVSAGTFKLSFNGKTTTPLPFNANAAQVQSALVALSSIGEGYAGANNVEVSGGPAPGATFTVDFVNYLGETPLPAITADSSGLTGGSVSVSVTKEGVSGYEVCDVNAHPTDVCQAGENLRVQAGAMKRPEGIAIDQQTGNLYVTDPQYNRISAYSATGEFEGAFGWGVINGSKELQFCTAVCLEGIGGKLDGGGGSLEGGGAGQLDGQIGHLDVAPAGSPHEGDLYIADARNNRVDEFKPAITAGKVTGVSFQRAFGWDVVESGPDNVPAANEVQSIEIPSSVIGGTFKVSFEGQSTPSLPYNATAFELQKAIDALPSIAPGALVGVSGGPTEHLPYKVTFEYQLSEANVSQLSVDSSALLGGEAQAQTLTQGASPERACDVAAHPTDVCKAGKSGPHDGQLSSPKDVGVGLDGTVYAVDGGSCNTRVDRCRVEKYNPNGGFEEELAPASLNGTQFHSLETVPQELTVDTSDGHVFVAKKNGTETAQVLEFDSSGNLLDTSPAANGFPARSASLALGTEGRLYLASFANPPAGVGAQVLILAPPPAPSATLGPVTGVGATSATFTGTVTPPAPGAFGGFATFYRFEYSTDGISWSRFPAEEDAEAGDGSGSGDPNGCPTEDPPSCKVTETVNGLQPNATYQVRLRATTGTAFTTPLTTFTTEAAPPTVSRTLAEEVEQTTAKLTGFINPNNQPATYHFEWGTTTAYGNEIPSFDAFTGEGGKAVKVTAPLSGLSPATAYHVRIVATNDSGTTTGPDREFLTLDEAGLPDDRKPELVSPADKRPQGAVRTILSIGLKYQAAEDGSALFYPILNGLLDSSAGGEVQYLARRGGAEWTSAQVTAPALVPSPVAQNVQTSLIHYLSPDLSCGLIESFEPLTGDTPAADVELGVTNLYRINPDGSHTLVSNTVPSNPTLEPRETSYEAAGMSADCSRAYFWSEYKLLPGASGLYEWDEGTLRDAGLLPDGTVAAKPTSFGGKPRPAWAGGERLVNAVSRDGRRLSFSATSDEGKDEGETAVFMREDGAGTVDASQTTTATAPLGARYEMASKDGSHLFFSANYGLTPDPSAGPSNGKCAPAAHVGDAVPCDLYSYDAESEALTDLSVDTNPADIQGAVVEGVLDASEDGSDVYFAALGQLIPGQGNTYKQNLKGEGFANVYLSREGQLSFVGILVKADLKGALARSVGNPSEWVAQATSDGKHLLFVSRANVTGYDSSGAPEAYLYSAESGKAVCVSCRPDGKPSLSDPSDRPIAIVTGAQPEQTIFPRSLSDDGSRVFFTMRDVLAPGAIAGNLNIYEWERGQVYLLNNGEGDASFIGSSASGDDVFIATPKQLDPHDTDFVRDVYDLRVGGGFPAPAEPPVPCDPAQDQCQGAPGTPPPASPSPSVSFTGPGNPPLAAPEKPGRKKHRKHRHKSQKHAAKQANSKLGGQK